jgi:hypothetical protein
MSHKITKNKYRKSCISKEGNNNFTKISLSSDEFIFSQTSIVSSVMLEDGTYCIHPTTSKFVNTNGDCWSNESLKANYKSFIGSFNYVNHVQEPEKSVGFLADATLRKILLDKEDKIFIYYTDILVATHKDSRDLVKKILSGKVEYLSMGCDAMFSICSKCGNVSEEDIDVCDCILNSKGKYYIDKYGKKRIIAEILGDDKPGSVTFSESSWLTEVPAFGGAVKRNILSIPEGHNVEVMLLNSALEREAVQKYVKL